MENKIISSIGRLKKIGGKDWTLHDFVPTNQELMKVFRLRMRDLV